jgi:hypothetical protein
MVCAQAGCRSNKRRSIQGTLMNAKSRVMESGPTTAQAQVGAAATPQR